MKHEERLNNFFERNKIIAMFANYVDLWRDLAFLLTIVLNIFILMAFDSKNGSIEGVENRLKEPAIKGWTVAET